MLFRSGDSGYIVDFIPGTPYRLSVNGHLSSLNDSAFALPKSENFAEFTVEIAGKYGNGFISKPLFYFGLTPQVAFFPENTGSDSTSITVSVAEGGDYLLDVGYHATGTLDVRRVSANSHPMGTIVMASTVSTQDDLSYSNMLHIKLLKGKNIIRFDQIRLPKSFTTCEPIHMRLIKY